MNLYFQFLTQNQTVEAIEMLGVLGSLLKGETLKGITRMSANAVISRSTFKGLDALMARRSKQRFQQLELVVDPIKAPLGKSAHITSLDGIFSPSPACALWLPT